MNVANSSKAEEERADLVGWISLGVILPVVCFAAPLVLIFNVVRAVRFSRADRAIPGPTATAIVLSGCVSVFWVWYLWRVGSGAYP